MVPATTPTLPPADVQKNNQQQIQVHKQVVEQPETQQTFNRQFIPQLFIPIDIEKKIALYNLYESQVRGHRSFDHLRHLAGVRGMQCNVPYAEAFQVMRLS